MRAVQEAEEGDDDDEEDVAAPAAAASASKAASSRADVLYALRSAEGDHIVNESVADIAGRIHARHKAMKAQEKLDDEAVARGDADANVLPSVKDPKLWVVKCKRGMGPGIIIALMNKFAALTVSARARGTFVCLFDVDVN